ncbi:MAG: hypothetical protein DLM67_21870, partial [Candidatus Nephthysia bennettiae]
MASEALEDGWLMLGILMSYLVVVGGGIGFVFPRSWWLSAATAWPLAPIGLPVAVALAAGYFASRLRAVLTGYPAGRGPVGSAWGA